MKIIHVVGARPNFMKMAPVFNALKKYKVTQLIVHTGQHYSKNMSDIFFSQLKLKKPDINLNVGSGNHAEQTAKIMIGLEKTVIKEKPNLVLVYGDVNSTMAASVVCSKLEIKVGHVEAGLRSFDMSMPEEINRIITDRLSSFLFIHSPEAKQNLINEGVKPEKIYYTGNVMIDTLINYLNFIKKGGKKIPFKEFGVVTLHRPSNVDDLNRLKKIMANLEKISLKIPLLFPMHPRTKKQLEKIKNINNKKNRIIILDPLGYTEFLNLVFRSKFLITDSGGIQEETTYLGLPCLTLRSNTERPITISQGTSTLIGDNFNLLQSKIDEILKGKYKKGHIPKKWDGQAAERIAKIIIKNKRKISKY